MLLFGIELEGFQVDPETNEVVIPSSVMPTDGYPGLVEFRTTGGKNLEDCIWKIFRDITESRRPVVFKPEHTFSAYEKQKIMQNVSLKEGTPVYNIYNKTPKLLGNKTIASCQINISNLVRRSYTIKKQTVPDSYSLVNIPTIVRNLDEEFSVEIKESKRQPGFYAIKDSYRLEYRSLPNTVFPKTPEEIALFASRIKKCMKN